MTWKSFYMLNRILNPIYFLNELFGQRVPKVLYLDKKLSGRLPFTERSFVPCPYCHTIHLSLKWNSINNTLLGNWYGLYCDNCGRIIPCIRNWMSLIFLIISFPIWICFAKSLKKKWLRRQEEKFSKPIKFAPPNFVWWLNGLQVGISYFVLYTLLKVYAFQEPFSLIKMKGLVGSILLGLLWGYLMKRTLLRKLNRKSIN